MAAADIFCHPTPESRDICRNFLRQVVCELRFPVLLEIAESEPSSLQKAIRASFPLYERQSDVAFDGVTTPRSVPKYLFQSRDRSWSLVLKQDSLALETSIYKCFSDFHERLGVVIGQLDAQFDIPFFTRVGLRFINVLPVNALNVLHSGWINPSLVTQLSSEGFSDGVTRFWSEIRGESSFGAFSFRHGFKEDADAYILDLDMSFVDCDPVTLAETIGSLRQEANKLFFWSVGAKSLEWMKGKEEVNDRP